MRGNSHVRFLGEDGTARCHPYPTCKNLAYQNKNPRIAGFLLPCFQLCHSPYAFHHLFGNHAGVDIPEKVADKRQDAAVSKHPALTLLVMKVRNADPA